MEKNNLRKPIFKLRDKVEVRSPNSDQMKEGVIVGWWISIEGVSYDVSYEVNGMTYHTPYMGSDVVQEFDVRNHVSRFEEKYVFPPSDLRSAVDNAIRSQLPEPGMRALDGLTIGMIGEHEDYSDSDLIGSIRPYHNPFLNTATEKDLDRMSSDYDLVKEFDRLIEESSVKMCECGFELVNSPVHSDWCPKYERF